MKTRLLTNKCRIKPNKQQEDFLLSQLENCDFVYNNLYKQYQQDLKEDLENHIVATYKNEYFYKHLEKLIEENPKLKTTNKHVLVDVYHRLLQSINAKNNVLTDTTDKHILRSFKIPKYDFQIINSYFHHNNQRFKLRNFRKFDGKILHAIIYYKRYEWHISIVYAINVKQLPKTGKAIGIDLGIDHFATLSDGRTIDMPDIEYYNDKIRNCYHKINQTIPGSQNNKRLKIQLQKNFTKKVNIKENFLHQLSMELVREYDIICVEMLEIQDILVNSNVPNKNILENDWQKFIRMLDYKSEFYMKDLVHIDRYFPSSKRCNVCGYMHQNMPLSVRTWECPSCHTKHNRDVNAAKNILNEGLRSINKH